MEFLFGALHSSLDNGWHDLLRAEYIAFPSVSIVAMVCGRRPPAQSPKTRGRGNSTGTMAILRAKFPKALDAAIIRLGSLIIVAGPTLKTPCHGQYVQAFFFVCHNAILIRRAPDSLISRLVQVQNTSARPDEGKNI